MIRNPALQPFVEALWLHEKGQRRPTADREWVLPTGAVHLVLRLEGPGLRLFRDADDGSGIEVGRALVGGARARPYLRDVSQPVSSIGVQLRPGAAHLLFGVPADELADRHTRLDELFGNEVRLLLEKLTEARDPSRKLEIFETFLASKLVGKELDPIVSHALARFEEGASLSAIVEESGYSHRHFIARFRRAVGLPPKLHARVLRFQRALRLMKTSSSLLRVALDAGYSDQAHFTREFRELSGLSPSRHRALAPDNANHVRVVKSFQDDAV